MTSVEINYIMIVLILIALILLAYVAHLFLRRWFLWTLPILSLLLMGLLYSIVYLVETAEGPPSNPLLFNVFNNILRGGSYLVMIAYMIAFIILQRNLKEGKDG